MDTQDMAKEGSSRKWRLLAALVFIPLCLLVISFGIHFARFAKISALAPHPNAYSVMPYEGCSVRRGGAFSNYRGEVEFRIDAENEFPPGALVKDEKGGEVEYIAVFKKNHFGKEPEREYNKILEYPKRADAKLIVYKSLIECKNLRQYLGVAFIENVGSGSQEGYQPSVDYF